MRGLATASLATPGDVGIKETIIVGGRVRLDCATIVVDRGRCGYGSGTAELLSNLVYADEIKRQPGLIVQSLLR